MRHDDSRADIWSLTATELALECLDLAQGSTPGIDKPHQLEAGRLYAEWQEAIHLPKLNAFDKSRRAALIAGLRKRTIEILIKAGLSE